MRGETLKTRSLEAKILREKGKSRRKEKRRLVKKQGKRSGRDTESKTENKNSRGELFQKNEQ